MRLRLRVLIIFLLRALLISSLTMRGVLVAKYLVEG